MTPRNMSGAIIDYWEDRARPVVDWIETGLHFNQAHRRDQGVQCGLCSLLLATGKLMGHKSVMCRSTSQHPEFPNDEVRVSHNYTDPRTIPTKLSLLYPELPHLIICRVGVVTTTATSLKLHYGN